MKKALKIVGIVFGLLLILIIAIPLFVDVDKFRPQIVKTANEKMNGTLELGHLQLSLWGHVSVKVDGMNVKDAQQKSVVSVKDVSFDVPFTSIIAGSPLVTLNMKAPAINVVKTKDGKLNVMSLMKNQAPAASAPANGGTTAAPAPGEKKVEMPSMLANARFGVSIDNATLSYIDQSMGLTNTVDHLNVRVKDFSLNRKTNVEIWADLKTQMNDLTLEGPVKLMADLSPEVSGGEFKSASVDATFTADDLAIQKGQLFQKKKGIPANFKFKGALSQEALKLEQAILKFHNAEIDVKGDYGKETGANIVFGAKPIELKSWGELIPMLKEYELEGKISLDGDVKGKPEALQYNAKLQVQNLAMKGPNLKAKPLINAEVLVATDRIEKLYADLKGPGNELVLNGKMVSFSHPQLTFSLNSPKGLDLDQWIEFPKTEKGTSKTASNEKGAAGGNAGKAPEANNDAMLDSVRKNEMLKNTTVDGTIALAFVKAKGMRMDDLSAKLLMKNLVMSLNNIRMKMYEGMVSGSFTTDLKPNPPQYTMNLAVNGLDLQKAVESQFESFKNTLAGKLSFSAQGGGSSFNPDLAKRHLQMKGDFKVANATFKSIDVAKMANDAIQGSLGKIASKVPFLQGKKINANANGQSKYEMISSNFTINNGVLDAPNFFAKAAPRAGIDIKGSTKMGLVDESLNANWQLIDTQQMTGASGVSVQVAGKTINNVLAKGEKDPVIVPIAVGCKWSAPCANYSQTPEYLAGIAANRLSHVATDVAKEKATGAVKNAIGNGLKGLFGH